MSLEQQIGALVKASENLTGAVNGKIGEIDKEVEQAKKEFKQFQSIADNRYLNVVSATASGHKLQNIYFQDWENNISNISPTKGCNALILSKKVAFSVDPAIRGDMAMIGTINALRIHYSKVLHIGRFIINYCESYTGRNIQLIDDELNGLSDWVIREVMLPTLDSTIPFYVLSKTVCLERTPNAIAFMGKMTFDGIFGCSKQGMYGNIGQYDYTGIPIMLADCGYTVPVQGVK